jgi:preprotein translocase subunit SecB
MKISPIQMHQFSFRRINVEFDAAHFDDKQLEKLERPLTFEGVNITTNVGLAPMEEGAPSGKNYLVTLQVLIDNKPSDGETSAKSSPYLIDVECGAIIRVLPGGEARPDIEDLVVVNGASLLWSTIREQVCNLTARMPLGLATLPTVNFHDLRKQSAAGTPATAKPIKSRASKAVAKPRA